MHEQNYVSYYDIFHKIIYFALVLMFIQISFNMLKISFISKSITMKTNTWSYLKIILYLTIHIFALFMKLKISNVKKLELKTCVI